MKLKKYDSTNCVGLRTNKEPLITFNLRGIISLNESALLLMDLSPGDAFSLLQDEDEPNDWYIAKDSNGFTLRNFGKTKSCATNSKALVQIFIKCIDKSGTGVLRVKIAKDPTKVGKEKYYGILLPSAIWHDKYSSG